MNHHTALALAALGNPSILARCPAPKPRAIPGDPPSPAAEPLRLQGAAIRRNALCPCRSGKKFKRCCGAKRYLRRRVEAAA
jgi:SEC-C motif